MSWTNDGNWEDLDASYWPDIMVDLINAVNEREKLLGMGTPDDDFSPWKIAYEDREYDANEPSEWEPLTKVEDQYGDLLQFPNYGDLSNVRIASIVGDSPWADNIERIREGIERFCRSSNTSHNAFATHAAWIDVEGDRERYYSGVRAKFIKDADVVTPDSFTLSDLLGRGSYGTTWVEMDRVTQHDIVNQIKEALQELIYVQWEPVPQSPQYVADLYEDTYQSSQSATGHGYDPDESWDDMYPPNYSTNYDLAIDWSRSASWSITDEAENEEGNYQTWIRKSSSTYSIDTDLISGEVIRSFIAWKEKNGLDFDWDWEYTVTHPWNQTYVIPYGTDDDVFKEKDVTNEWDISSSIQVEFNTGVPEENPEPYHTFAVYADVLFLEWYSQGPPGVSKTTRVHTDLTNDLDYK